MRIVSKYKVLNPTTLPLTRTTYLAATGYVDFDIILIPVKTQARMQYL